MWVGSVLAWMLGREWITVTAGFETWLIWLISRCVHMGMDRCCVDFVLGKVMDDAWAHL